MALPLAPWLGNYRDGGTRVISKLAHERLGKQKPREDNYVLTLNSDKYYQSHPSTYEAKKVEKGPAKSKKKAAAAKDDSTTPDTRTIVGYLRDPVMWSAKDGSYRHGLLEAGTFGTKTITGGGCCCACR